MILPTRRALLWGLVLFIPVTLAGVIVVAKTVHSDAVWWAPVLWILLLPGSLVFLPFHRISQDYEWFMDFVLVPLAIAVQYGYCIALVVLLRKLRRADGQAKNVV
jgi:hypothetical protein